MSHKSKQGQLKIYISFFLKSNKIYYKYIKSHRHDISESVQIRTNVIVASSNVSTGIFPIPLVQSVVHY